MKLKKKTEPTVEQRIADAHARNGARDFATAMFLMILIIIAIDSKQAPAPTAQKAEPEKSETVLTKIVTKIAEVVL